MTVFVLHKHSSNTRYIFKGKSTCRCAAAVTVSLTEAAGPRQRGLEGGEHVVYAVGDDDVIVN